MLAFDLAVFLVKVSAISACLIWAAASSMLAIRYTHIKLGKETSMFDKSLFSQGDRLWFYAIGAALVAGFVLGAIIF